MAIYVEKIPNRASPSAVFIRQAWRAGKRIRRKTLANISKLPPAGIESIRSVLKGGVVFDSLDEAVTIRRPLPHGHVAAVLGLCRQLGLPRLLLMHCSRFLQRDLALTCVGARVLFPVSQVVAARFLSHNSTATLVQTVRQEFGMDRVALAGDRGMLTTASIRGDLQPASLDWVSALKTADLRTLL